MPTMNKTAERWFVVYRKCSLLFGQFIETHKTSGRIQDTAKVRDSFRLLGTFTVPAHSYCELIVKKTLSL